MREPAISSGEAPSSSVDLLKSLNQSFHLSTTPSAPLQPGKGLFFFPSYQIDDAIKQPSQCATCRVVPKLLIKLSHGYDS